MASTINLSCWSRRVLTAGPIVGVAVGPLGGTGASGHLPDPKRI
jgi:hypothetical protein